MPPKVKKKIKTGFCANKQCEGTKPVSPSGAPMKVCDAWEDCACDCHEMVTQMYKMADLPREEPQQSAEYLAAVSARHMATARMLAEVQADMMARAPLSRFGGIMAPPPDEGTLSDAVDTTAGTLETGYHGTVTPRFVTTPTGRRARGQLEYDVLTVCGEFSRDVYEWDLCTPKLVAERIGKMHDTEPPSTGAINAVWDRWEKIGFAQQGRKPSHFIMFEIDDSLQTLAMLKDRIKRDKKRSQTEAKRGSIRPKGR